METVHTITNYPGGAESQNVTLEVRHYASSGSDALVLPFVGVPSGNNLTFTGLRTPPLPPPPPAATHVSAIAPSTMAGWPHAGQNTCNAGCGSSVLRTQMNRGDGTT